jgi:hypothetical protein
MAISEARNEFPVLEGRGGEAAEQQHDGRVGGVGFTIEDIDSVGLYEVVRGKWDMGHDDLWDGDKSNCCG